MGKMKELAIDMANKQGVSIKEIIYNEQLDDEHQYEQFKKEQAVIEAEKSNFPTKEGGHNAR